jgi:hypothetical protein
MWFCAFHAQEKKWFWLSVRSKDTTRMGSFPPPVRSSCSVPLDTPTPASSTVVCLTGSRRSTPSRVDLCQKQSDPCMPYRPSMKARSEVSGILLFCLQSSFFFGVRLRAGRGELQDFGYELCRARSRRTFQGQVNTHTLSLPKFPQRIIFSGTTGQTQNHAPDSHPDTSPTPSPSPFNVSSRPTPRQTAAGARTPPFSPLRPSGVFSSTSWEGRRTRSV